MWEMPLNLTFTDLHFYLPLSRVRGFWEWINAAYIKVKCFSLVLQKLTFYSTQFLSEQQQQEVFRSQQQLLSSQVAINM